MNQTYRILPVYTSDVSGVCSALYELGGMVVIHDPSGCNSTYNTHDEIRWYKKDSLIFISALTERDAVMGNDKKFYDDVLCCAKELRPGFVAVTNSPVPYMMGTDFPALMRKLERELGIPCFYVPANGMHDYTMGAGRAFLCAAERLVNGKYVSTVKNSVNIIGMTPLDYAAAGSTEGICHILEDAGYKINSVWAMDAPAEDIVHSAEASVNLVVSSTGLFAAKRLKDLYKIPYVVGTPVEGFDRVLLKAIEEALQDKKDITAYMDPSVCHRLCAEKSMRKEPGQDTMSCTLIGEPVVNGSVAAAMRLGCGTVTRVLCPTEITEGLLRETDISVHGEEEIIEQLKAGDTLIADPMYRYICPAGTRLCGLPSLSLSGRIYAKKIPRITDLNACSLYKSASEVTDTWTFP